MNVILIKLVTGETVIAETQVVNGADDKPEHLMLKNPASLILSREGAALLPLSPFSQSDTIKINLQHVIYTAIPDTEISNGYSAQFGSGLVTPPGGLIL